MKPYYYIALCKPKTSKIPTPIIEDGVTVLAGSYAACVERGLAALKKQFDRDGHPKFTLSQYEVVIAAVVPGDSVD